MPVTGVFASAQHDFQIGIRAFKDKKYQQAIQSFERARQQGMSSSALYYDLAVSYFKIGDYNQARRWFIKSRQYTKIKYLSEYNLGLVAIKQKRKKTALGHFKNVAKHAREKNLVKLANYQISRLRKEAPRPWSAFAQVKYGHDNNVTTVTDNSPTKKASTFIDLYAYGSVKLYGTSKQGLMLNAYVFDTQYKAASQYDIQVRNLGLNQAFSLGRFRNSIGVNYQQTTLAGQDFQKAAVYDLKTRYLLGSKSDIRLRYRYYDINSMAPYQELSGSKQRLRLEYRHSSGMNRLKLYSEYENNDRSETSSTPRSYSPTRYTLRGTYTYSFNRRLSLTGDLAYRISNYPAGATGLAREDTRTKTNLELDYDLNKTWFLSAEYGHTDNGSDDPAYRYKQNISAVSINASF